MIAAPLPVPALAAPALPLLDRATDVAPASPDRVPADIRRAADGFESLFVAALLEPLERSAEALFGAGPDGRTIGGLFREQLAVQIAAARPLGVADLVERQLLERAGSPPVPAAGAAQRAALAYGKAPR